MVEKTHIILATKPNDHGCTILRLHSIMKMAGAARSHTAVKELASPRLQRP